MLPDRPTRLLHCLLAPAITAQLAVSAFMHHPKPGRAGDGLYQIHETLGLALFALLVLFWLWVMVRRGRIPASQLFPWFTPSRFPPLLADAGRYADHLRRFRLPPHDAPSPLTSAIQGLGLTAALLLAVSGALIFLYASPNEKMTGWLRIMKEGHEILGVLMWFYLALHPMVGFLHQWSGHLRVGAMFRFWEKDVDQPV